MKMNPVVHFEMLAKDKGRMRRFYETAFGWQTEQLGKGLPTVIGEMMKNGTCGADRSCNAGILADEEIRYCEIKESIRGR